MSGSNKKRNGWGLYSLFRKSIAVILFFALWEILPRIGVYDSQFIPKLTDVLSTLWTLAQKGELYKHTIVSLERTLGGFGLAIAVAIPIGFLLGGWFKTIEEYLDPLLQILAQVNPFSLFPVFIVFLGIGEISKITIIFWVCVWPIIFNTINGVKSIDPLLVKAARAMGTSKLVLFWKVVLPGAAPTIFTGLKLGAGSAFFMLIAAEMIGASKGLGWLILNSQINYQIPRLFAAVFTIAVIGFIITYLINLIEKRVINWKEESHAG